MKVVDGKFACEACGKRYTWKPQLAGKKAKCSCGATMVVPQAEAPAANDEPEDLYGFADDALPPATVARPLPMAAPVASAAHAAQTGGGGGVGALGYRSAPTKENTKKDRFAFDEMTQPARDLYVPVALIIVGLLGILAWAMYLGAGPVMIAIVALASGTATLIKGAILIVLAFWIAPLAGISFGELRTAVLKFAAIVIFTDAAGLWFEEVLEAVGEIRGDKRTIRSLFYSVALTATLISVLSYYLFDMDGEETGMFAVPFALASEAAGWVLNLIVMGIIGALLASGAAPPAAPPPVAGAVAPATPGATAPAPPPPGVPLQANARDREIERMIGSGTRMVTEANEYNQSQPQKSKREPQLVAQFYGAGAKRVYFDYGGGRMFVQLPDDAGSRAKCFAISGKYDATSGAKRPAPKEEGQRYLEVEMKVEKR